MALIDELRIKVDTLDLLLLTLTESANNHPDEFATPGHIAPLIGGSTVARVYGRLHRLSELGAVDERPLPSGQYIYLLNNLGAQLLISEVEGWEAGGPEQARRDRELARAIANPKKRSR